MLLNNRNLVLVLNFDYSVTLGSNADALVGTLTVPAGKVWKITAASSQDVSNNEYSTAIAVNNHLLYQYLRSNSTAAVSNNTPYWLANKGCYLKRQQ